MALEFSDQYTTYSRNVVLRDTSLEVYKGIDLRSCSGVQFDVYMVTDGVSGPLVDLGLEVIRIIIEASQYDPENFDDTENYTLSVDLINSSEVIYSPIIDFRVLDAMNADHWKLLAMGAVERLLHNAGEVSEKVERVSRYRREPLI